MSIANISGWIAPATFVAGAIFTGVLALWRVEVDREATMRRIIREEIEAAHRRTDEQVDPKAPQSAQAA